MQRNIFCLTLCLALSLLAPATYTQAAGAASSGEASPGVPVDPDSPIVSSEVNEAYYEALERSPAFEAWVESQKANNAAPAAGGKAGGASLGKEGASGLQGDIRFKKYRATGDAKGAGLELVIDYPADGASSEAAAVRRAVDALLDGCSHWDELELKPGKAEPGNLQNRLDGLARAFAKLSEDETGRGVTYGLYIEAAHQDRKTATFKVQDSSWSFEGPMPPDFVTVRKSDGSIVESREIFTAPRTDNPAPAADGAAAFVAAALEFEFRVGVSDAGLLCNVATEQDEEPLIASWAEIEPYLTPQGRELFAEHLPNKGK